jgi:hypothetical protein
MKRRRTLECIVSGRSLRFGEPEKLGEDLRPKMRVGTPVFVDVLTENEIGVTRKICSLCVTIEDMRQLLDDLEAAALPE